MSMGIYTQRALAQKNPQQKKNYPIYAGDLESRRLLLSQPRKKVKAARAVYRRKQISFSGGELQREKKKTATAVVEETGTST